MQELKKITLLSLEVRCGTILSHNLCGHDGKNVPFRRDTWSNVASMCDLIH